ncbi:hypothetical protein HK096_007240 [Nowakowskiella sp. JEL0078]|nr:hypothetical protein HK096_007240 [Nowakowskiella sp. JEL0078]
MIRVSFRIRRQNWIIIGLLSSISWVERWIQIWSRCKLTSRRREKDKIIFSRMFGVVDLSKCRRSE